MNAVILLSFIISWKPLPEEIRSRVSNLEDARKFSIENSEDHYAKYDRLEGIWLTPVLPNLSVFAFDREYNNALFVLEKHPKYESNKHVAIDRVRKITRILTPESFGEFIDTSDVARIKNERDVFNYVEFVLEAVYHRIMLVYQDRPYDDDNDLDWGALRNRWIRLYLKWNLPDSSENYFTRIKENPEGYLVTTYAFRDVYKRIDNEIGFNPDDLRVSKWTFLVKRNGVLLDVKTDSLPLPPHMKNLSLPVNMGNLLLGCGKNCVDVTLSSALADRKCLRQPLPPYPEWAQKQGLSATVRFDVKVNAEGKIRNKIIVISSGYPDWDMEVIKWLEHNWRWEKSDSETEGTIEINFGQKMQKNE